uniref:Peptidase M13 N-terminal domain-containing protein n=1 Tax=Caenorhabditis japonica TaxID=281687 RepID=A0A8R1HLL3_CAEJA
MADHPITSKSQRSQSEKSKKSKKSDELPKIPQMPAGTEEQSRPTPCTVLAVVVTLFILILLIFALGQFGFHEESDFKWDHNWMAPVRKRLNQPCTSLECVRYAAQLFAQMDMTIQPCVDFHTHVCSGFNPQKRRLEHIFKLIEPHDKNVEHREAATIVYKMFSKCVKERQLGLADGWKSIILPRNAHHLDFPILTTSSYPSSNSSELTALIIHISAHFPENIGGFLSIQPSQDSEFSLFVVKPNVKIPTEFEYRNVLEILLKPRDVIIDVQEVERTLTDVMRLQKRLQDIPFSTEHSVVELSKIQKSLDFIDWKLLVDSWYPSNSSTNTLADKIYGFDSKYYETVSTVISEYPHETLLNLLILHFSYEMLRTQISAEREQACLLQVSSVAPGRILIQGSAEEEGLEKLTGMLKTVKQHLRTSLANLKWMDRSGMDEAQRKFNRTEFRFGFDGANEIEELKFPPNSSYFSMLQLVLRWGTRKMFESIAEDRETVFLNTEAFYHVEKNRITISRALLHYPFISARLPEYINFATISARIVPQLIHVFDERGRFYDSEGVYRDWWSQKTNEHFRMIIACFDNFMQDVLGVAISIGLNAYNSTVSPYEVLPGKQNSSDIALFFYSLVNTMCESDGTRVNEALVNVPQFDQEFKCKRKSLSTSVENKLDIKCKLAA